MNHPLTRRAFLAASAGTGIGCAVAPGLALTTMARCCAQNPTLRDIPLVMAGEAQLFVDDVMIGRMAGVRRRSHPAKKLDRPVLEGTKPWERFAETGAPRPLVATYGTVLRDEVSGAFRMWYNSYKTTCHATSSDGINWNRPQLNPWDRSNAIDLFGFHSPSIIHDQSAPDPEQRYKAIGSKEGFDSAAIARLKGKFNSSAWYRRNQAYAAAYSADGLHWTMYPEPALMGLDTITLAQDPVTGEYLAFHKNTQDPRSVARQIFLSVSRDMQRWSEPDLVMATDEEDHREARKLDRGTHSEFYNMSAFRHGSQWLGLVTHFRCVGEPLVAGKAKPGQKGVIDVQLVHSRDGRTWSRCSDRSPVIPCGPHRYDAGMVFGVCNTPVLVGDEMWMYYSAATDAHASSDPDRSASVGRAAWRLDGMVSLSADGDEGVIETVALQIPAARLWVNADVNRGQLAVEALDAEGRVLPGYEAANCDQQRGAGVRQRVKWARKEFLPEGRPIRLRFRLTDGDLYSYVFT